MRSRIGQRNPTTMQDGWTTPGLLPCRPWGLSFSDRVEGTCVYLKWGSFRALCAQCSCTSPVTPSQLHTPGASWSLWWPATTTAATTTTKQDVVSLFSEPRLPTHIILLLNSQCPCLSLVPAVSSLSVPSDSRYPIHICSGFGCSNVVSQEKNAVLQYRRTFFK